MYRKAALPVLSSLLILAFPSCMLVGPDFKTPESSLPAAWSAKPASSADLASWWKSFNDSQLDSLIRQAIAANPDLQIAKSQLKQARARRIITAAPLYPAIGSSLSSSRQSPSGLSSGSIATFGGALDASWEVDIFGGNTRAVESADASVVAAQASLDDVRISLLAEVAMLYCDWIAASEQISIAEQQLAYQKESEIIAKSRFELGFTSKVDFDNAAAQVAQTQAQIPPLRTQLNTVKNTLATLLGKYPDQLTLKLPSPKTLNYCPMVPVGVPSDILRRRPDIRRAEADLHAATANIGVAIADLYPKFSLTGSLSSGSRHFADFFKKDSANWSLGGFVSWPVFQGGRLRGNVELQKALKEQAALNYQKTLLNAVSEVENNLIAYAQVQIRIDALRKAVDANTSSADLAIKLYKEGKTNFLNVLTAQRSLLSSQEALIAANQNLRQYVITLGKALGGGWEM